MVSAGPSAGRTVEALQVTAQALQIHKSAVFDRPLDRFLESDHPHNSLRGRHGDPVFLPAKGPQQRMITTVAGSYPKVPNRPRAARLRNALNRLDRGAITPAEVDQIRDDVTREVIAEQVEAGLDQVTDGQIRWDDEVTYFARSLSGVSLNGLFRYFDTNTYFRQPVIQGPVGWEKPITVADYQFAAAESPKPVKAVLPSPYSLASHSIDDHYGGRRDDLVLDLASAVNQEARALADAGAPVVQLNEPMLTWHKDDVSLARRGLERAFDGVNTERQVNFYFGDLNGVLGSLVELPVEIIGLDFVMGPANFQAIEAVQLNQKLCAGVVDARNTRLESEPDLTTAIRRLSEVVGYDRLLVSPNMGLEFLPRERALEQLRGMVAVARRAEGVPA
jgi:5-methyltetrahydropteroyltriglutamate--homocysteine methyltransferase